MAGKMVFVPDRGLPEGTRICDTLFNLFREDAIAQGIEVPIDGQQKEAWLRFIVPRIEGAYGRQVYTPLEQRLDRALCKIRQFCATFHVSSDEIIGEILAVQTPEGSEH